MLHAIVVGRADDGPRRVVHLPHRPWPPAAGYPGARGVNVPACLLTLFPEACAILALGSTIGGHARRLFDHHQSLSFWYPSVAPMLSGSGVIPTPTNSTFTGKERPDYGSLCVRGVSRPVCGSWKIKRIQEQQGDFSASSNDLLLIPYYPAFIIVSPY